MTVVHYLNQFFAGLGGEEAAGHEPVRIDGAVGPGRGFEGAGLEIDVTLACGDDRFGEHEEESLARLLAWLDEIRPDVLVCGPSFGSGRYGYACGSLAREAGRRGIPVVSGMTPDSPGVLAAEGAAYIVPTGPNVASMRDGAPGDGEPRDAPGRGRAGRVGRGRGIPAARAPRPTSVPTGRGRSARSTCCSRRSRGDVRTEVVPSGDRVAPPPAVPDVTTVKLALVTEAGCVPQGNPDRLPTRHANVWLRYPLAGVDTLAAGAYESVHAGFDTTAANADPNRLVPLDAVRELEAEGRIGSLHDTFYTTSGVDTPVATSAKFGREIAQELRDAGVEAVILTGT